MVIEEIKSKPMENLFDFEEIPKIEKPSENFLDRVKENKEKPKKRGKRKLNLKDFKHRKINPILVFSKLTRDSTLDEVFNIWKRKGYVDSTWLDVFTENQNLSEKEQSIELWEGCDDSHTWEVDKPKWQKLNDLASYHINKIVGGEIELTLITEKTIEDTGETAPHKFIFGRVFLKGKSIMCKYDDAITNHKLDRWRNHMTTLLGKSYELNDKMEMNRNILLDVANESTKRIQASGLAIEEQNEKIQIMHRDLIHAHKNTPPNSSTLLGSIKKHFEGNRDIKDKDEKINDGLTQSREDRK